VAGLRISLFTDEMIDPRLAIVLGHQGYDMESCQEAGRANLALDDDEQLAYASRHGRALLTFNSDDFHRLDRRWRLAGRQHAGIIVSGQISDFGVLVRRVRLHLDTIRPEDQFNRVLQLAR
jgi:predicted nuclease of predicted toxin-antitoxin system